MTNKNQVQFLVMDSKTGQKYTDVKDLPPELLAKLEGKLETLKDENGDGIPDGLREYFPDQAHFNVNQVTSFDSKEMLKKFFVNLIPFSGLIKLSKNGNNFSSSSSTAVEPAPFKGDGSEKIKALLILLAILVIAVYLGWEWIVNFFVQLGTKLGWISESYL